MYFESVHFTKRINVFLKCLISAFNNIVEMDKGTNQHSKMQLAITLRFSGQFVHETGPVMCVYVSLLY